YWRGTVREKAKLTLLMIDEEFFKSNNDTFGHVAADEALRQVAGAIREGCTRSSGLAGRYGGGVLAQVQPG
ncbi:diguanylate cyclase, partial [Pseudomonas aeruginosa]|uniref:diguanylate cyclase n=1 Tax=Pseudomonas aeruginosa TaxID=287 RepID=UPI003F80BEF6